MGLDARFGDKLLVISKLVALVSGLTALRKKYTAVRCYEWRKSKTSNVERGECGSEFSRD